jgi:hypothetical protein
MGRLLRFYTVVPSDGEKASIRGAVMSKSLLSFITAAAFFVATLTPSLAQEITQPSVQPIPILAGQSSGAGTGGTDSGGATAPAPPPAAAEPVQPLPPAQPAGPQQAAFFANPAAIGGAALVTAIVVCAFVCFSHSSSTTTSTTVQH